MIKLVIFDIDGVLVSTRKLHEIAFIKALNQCGIKLTEEEHTRLYDGLPTKTKLDMLGVKSELAYRIFDLKQKLTFELADGHINKNEELIRIVEYLRSKEIKIAVCSNAIRDFCALTIKTLGLNVDLILSNEDVSKPKPDPEIYNRAISMFKVDPRECIIFEDSQFGITAAARSGATLCVIQDPSYLTLDKVRHYVTMSETGV